jgi:membrane associated rhomboid family serine protease
MIPLRDVIPSRTVPFVTVGLIALNALAFLFEMSLPDDVRQAFVNHYGLVPVRFTWTSVLTSMFLHASWSHIIGNMWFLWIFGDNVEDRFGHFRYFVFYLLCGIVGGVAQTLTAPWSFVPTVGASGAIAGVMGAYFLLYPRSRVLTMIFPFIFWIVEVPAVFFLGYWFLIQLFSGVGTVAVSTGTTPTGGVAFWAHIAGFLTGILMVFVFKRPERQRVEWWDV